MLNMFGPTSPPLDAENLDIASFKQILGKMTAGKPRYARDEYAFFHILNLERRPILPRKSREREINQETKSPSMQPEKR